MLCITCEFKEPFKLIPVNADPAPMAMGDQFFLPDPAPNSACGDLKSSSHLGDGKENGFVFGVLGHEAPKS